MSQSTKLSRRSLIQGLGIVIGTAPLASFLACSGGSDSSSPSANGDAAAGGDGKSPLDDVVDPGAWATGGTKSMTGDYPDPFALGLGATCSLTCAATLGPCYAATVERKDISEGQDGLPTRLVLLIVDESCTPIANASVDIWHCAPSGLYSGDDASDFCTSGDEVARSGRWFRGVQTTDANGRVEFDTCFPGWYSSRTIHIHFTIRVNGTEYVTSQLVFDDALDDEIIASQPLYDTRGARDTLNTNDNVVGGAEDLGDYTFETKRMADGAMLAWKAIVLRSSTGAALCSIGGGGGEPGEGGPGGPGGPPPDGGFEGGPPPGGGM